MFSIILTYLDQINPFVIQLDQNCAQILTNLEGYPADKFVLNVLGL